MGASLGVYYSWNQGDRSGESLLDISTLHLPTAHPEELSGFLWIVDHQGIFR